MIISSLVENSITHGFENNSGIITLTSTVQEDTLTLTYHDNGKGIKPELLEKVFLPFYTTSMANKSGLGLSIIYNFVTHLLNSELICISKMNEGTTIKAIIPMTEI